MLLALAGGLSLAIWIYILAARRSAWREEPAGSPRSWPSIVAVIPARNEEETIAAAVESLDRQKYRGEFRIVVVDDHSEDATTVRALSAAPASRLAVVRAATLPAGWTGKVWAMSEGVRLGTRFAPDYFLFTDADIVHPPDLLSGLVARADEGRYALVSYMVTLRCRTIAERALIPAFVYFFFLLYPPRRSAGAAGGCMLLRGDALEAAGGMESIRGELIDDCALARAVQATGGAVWLGLGARSESIRDYRTFGEVGRMISRSAFTQLRYSTLLLIGTLAAMAITFVFPPVLALAAPMPGRAMSAAAWLLMSISYALALRFYRRSVLWAPLLPLVAMFYGGCTVHSAMSHWLGRGGMWKGRAQG